MSPSTYDPTRLPFELVTLIFQNLSGQDLRCARLVSRDWEACSRSCFAARHFSRSIFWLTSSSLHDLDQISRKFGFYMRTVYIASDCFSIAGLVGIIKEYLHIRRKTRKYNAELQRMVPTSYSILDVKVHHLGQYFKHQRWPQVGRCTWFMGFFASYTRSIFSQWWLRISGQDVANLTAVLDRVPQCNMEVVNLNYEIGKLHANAIMYGKPAPDHAFELALFIAGRSGHVDAGYLAHAEGVVREAIKQRESDQSTYLILARKLMRLFMPNRTAH